MFWAAVRFVLVGLPLAISLAAARRALQSKSGNAAVYIMYSGFAAVSGLTVLPWAMYFEPPNIPSLILAISAIVAWGALNKHLRRPIAGYRPSAVPDGSASGLGDAARARRQILNGGQMPNLPFIQDRHPNRLN